MSRYQRKTVDLFVVQQYFSGYGWEDVSAADTRKEAREDRKAYQENQPEYPVRIVVRREPIAKVTA